MNVHGLEEIHIFGPTDMHSNAMELYSQMKKANPDDRLDADGPFMKRAKERAVKRFMLKSEEELFRHVS